MTVPPQPGDVVFVGRPASVQFGGDAAFHFRVIGVDERPTYGGWVWLEGYQLDSRGDAVQRRSVFVCVSGLMPCQQTRLTVRPRPTVRRAERL
jgi:hypothetical protein